MKAGSLYGALGACIGWGFSFLILAGLESDFARAFAAFVLDFVCRAAIGRSEKCPLTILEIDALGGNACRLNCVELDTLSAEVSPRL